jgi:hypothetical protein
MTEPTQIFVIGDQVQLVVTQHYVPADHSKDVVGIVGRVTGIDKHFEHDSLWLYKVTFPHYNEYRVFNHAAPAKRVEEEIELTFWYDQLELVDMEAQA